MVVALAEAVCFSLGEEEGINALTLLDVRRVYRRGTKSTWGTNNRRNMSGVINGSTLALFSNLSLRSVSEAQVALIINVSFKVCRSVACQTTYPA